MFIDPTLLTVSLEVMASTTSTVTLKIMIAGLYLDPVSENRDAARTDFPSARFAETSMEAVMLLLVFESATVDKSTPI